MFVGFIWTPAMPPVPVASPPVAPVVPVPNAPGISIPKAGLIGLIPTIFDLFFPAPLVSPEQEQQSIKEAENKPADFTNGGDWVEAPNVPFKGGQCNIPYDIVVEVLRRVENNYVNIGASNVGGPISSFGVIPAFNILGCYAKPIPGLRPDGAYTFSPGYSLVTPSQPNGTAVSYKVISIKPSGSYTGDCGDPPPINTPVPEKSLPPLVSPEGLAPPPILPQLIPPIFDIDDKVGLAPDLQPSPDPEKIGTPFPFPDLTPLDSPPLAPPEFPIPAGLPPISDKPPITPFPNIPGKPSLPNLDKPLSFDPLTKPELQPEPLEPEVSQKPLPDLCELIKNCSDCECPPCPEVPEIPLPKYRWFVCNVSYIPQKSKMIMGSTPDKTVLFAGHIQITYAGYPIAGEIPIRRNTQIFSIPLDPLYGFVIQEYSGYNISTEEYISVIT